MAQSSKKTIRILTPTREHVALRENDPIWGRFTPPVSRWEDIELLEVTGAVGELFDAQWDDYMRLLEYLDGIAYVTFSLAPKRGKGRGDKKATPPSIEETEYWEHIDVSTRGNVLASAARFSDFKPVGHYQFTDFPEVTLKVRGKTHKLTIAPFKSDQDRYLAVVQSKPEDVLFFDQVGHTARILQPSLGWEMWVPVRTLTDDVTERIQHTIQAGVWNTDIGVPLATPTYYLGDLSKLLPWWLMDQLYDWAVPIAKISDSKTLPQAYAYCVGALQFATTIGLRDGSVSDSLVAGGVIWDDVYDVLLQEVQNPSGTEKPAVNRWLSEMVMTLRYILGGSEDVPQAGALEHLGRVRSAPYRLFHLIQSSDAPVAFLDTLYLRLEDASIEEVGVASMLVDRAAPRPYAPSYLKGDEMVKIDSYIKDIVVRIGNRHMYESNLQKRFDATAAQLQQTLGTNGVILLLTILLAWLQEMSDDVDPRRWERGELLANALAKQLE